MDSTKSSHPLPLLLLLILLLSSIVDATDFDGCTALHHAARSGTCRVVELLLAASPTLLDVVDKDGCTALLYAVKRGHEAIVNRLLALNPKNLEAGADANGFTRDAADGGGISSSLLSSNSMNVLHHAISQRDRALVWRLLETSSTNLPGVGSLRCPWR